MSRRSHKKSKNGCLECKRRHVKCDETRQSCVNCSVAETYCSFNDTPPYFAENRHSRYADHTLPSPDISSITDYTIDSHSGIKGPTQFVANVDHLEFLYHFCTETWNGFLAGQTAVMTSFHAVSKFAFLAPYLMHEMLAIGALHLSVLRPGRQDFYRNYAAGLQTRALSLFNSTDLDVNATNCVPVFLFSSFLGIHVLCDTLAHREDHNSSNILDRFAHYLDLHHGVRAVARQTWHLLRETELKPIIQATDALSYMGESPGSECEDLKVLIKSGDLGPSSTQAYQLAISHLQWVFDAERSMPEQSANVIFAWPVLAPAEYAALLALRRPEALVILAHYGVLLHRHRHLWVIGDGGRFLIETIIKHLGPHWTMWLAWPNAMLDATSPHGYNSFAN